MAGSAWLRPGRAVAPVLAGLVLLLLEMQSVAPRASASPGGTITVDSTTTTVPTKLIVNGWCAQPAPATTPLLLDGTQLVVEKVDATLGTWGPERVLLGSDVTPGRHVLTTGCGGSATVTVTGVVRQPTLVISPTTAHLPATITLTGTCPVGTKSVELFVDQQDRGPLPIDVATGALLASTLHLGAATPVGSHIIGTSCGASASFTALAAPVPPPTSASPPRTSAPATPTPTVQRVRVPDLVGLTVAQAKAVLGDSLRLGGPTGTTARIRTQDPAAGTLVAAGSVVTVTFERPVPWWQRSMTAWLVAGTGVLLLLVLATTWWVGYLRRDRRRPPPSGGPGGAQERPTAPLPTTTGRR